MRKTLSFLHFNTHTRMYSMNSYTRFFIYLLSHLHFNLIYTWYEIVSSPKHYSLSDKISHSSSLLIFSAHNWTTYIMFFNNTLHSEFLSTLSLFLYHVLCKFLCIRQQRVSRTFILVCFCDVMRTRRAPASAVSRLKKGLCLKHFTCRNCSTLQFYERYRINCLLFTVTH